MLRQIDILGYSVLNEPVARVATEVCDRLGGGDRLTCVFLNPHSVVLAQRDAPFRQAVAAASAVFCDGIGLSLASLLLNRHQVHRVYGYEFFIDLVLKLQDAHCEPDALPTRGESAPAAPGKGSRPLWVTKR